MPQPYFEIEESRSVTPWVNRLYFESPRASSFLGLRLVKKRHKNLVPLLSGVKPDTRVGSGRYAEPIPVKSPLVMGVKVSLVCSNSTVFLRMDIFPQHGEVINSINPRDSYMHHWRGSPMTQSSLCQAIV